MEVVKLDDLRCDEFYDSRGQKLKDGDVVVFMNDSGVYIYAYLKKKVNSYNESYYLLCKKYGTVYFYKSTYMIKIYNYSDTYKDWLDLNINNRGFNPHQNGEVLDIKAEKWYFEHYCEDKYKRENDKKSTLGFPVTEYFNKPLNVGDLVLILENGKAPMYALYMSPTKVFTQNLKMEAKHFVLKLEDLNDEEIQVYNFLLNQYQKSVKKKNSNNIFNIGDIYRDNEHVYVYFGNFNFNYKYLDKSTTFISKDIKLGKWVCLSLSFNQYSDLISNKENFIEILKMSMYDNEEESYHTKTLSVKGNFCASYNEVCDFKVFCDDIKKSAVYGGHLDLNKELVLDFLDDFKNSIYYNLQLHFVLNK